MFLNSIGLLECWWLDWETKLL